MNHFQQNEQELKYLIAGMMGKASTPDNDTESDSPPEGGWDE